MKRRDFFRKLLSPCRTLSGMPPEGDAHEAARVSFDPLGDSSETPERSNDMDSRTVSANNNEGEQELFLKAMALGIDPATVDPEILRKLVHVNP